MDAMSIARNAVYYTIYPILYILRLTFYILAVVTAPLQHLAHYFAHACWYPIHILAKFETLYIFFGVAVLIGILSGTVLHYVSAFGFTVLNLERHSEKQSGKSIDSYRAEKQMRAEQKDPFLKLKRRDVSVVDGGGGLSGGYADWQRPKQDRGRTGPRLVPNTILEEDSTDDGF